MSVVYDRIYIRFKGRVLGPLAHDKVIELVSRGQITRDHDMSSDAVNWAKASEFTTFFPPTETKVAQNSPPNDEPKVPAVETWYLNLEGENVKSFDEPTIKKMIADGKLKSSHQLWNQDAGLWQEVGEFRPQWFAGVGRSFGTADPGGGDINWQSLGEQLLMAKPWLNILSIFGLIIGTIVFITTSGLFIVVSVSNYSVASKLCLVVALIGQIFSALAWLHCFTRLLKYNSLLVALKFRNEPVEISAVVAGQSLLWRTVSIVFLGWIGATLIGLLSILIAWQVEPNNSDYEFGSLPLSIAFNPAEV